MLVHGSRQLIEALIGESIILPDGSFDLTKGEMKELGHLNPDYLLSAGSDYITFGYTDDRGHGSTLVISELGTRSTHAALGLTYNLGSMIGRACFYRFRYTGETFPLISFWEEPSQQMFRQLPEITSAIHTKVPDFPADPTQWVVRTSGWWGTGADLLAGGKRVVSDPKKAAETEIARMQHLARPEVKRAMGIRPQYAKDGPSLRDRQQALTSESVDIPSPGRQYLCERMTYNQLLKLTTPARRERAKHVRGPSLKLETSAGSNYYHFNFRGYPSTTGHRHVGYVRFLKPPNPDTPLGDVNCEVDCTCEDMKYRWAWANKQRQAGLVGPGSYNKSINRAPRITNPKGRPGLCKHCAAVGAYLGALVYKMPEELSAPERLGRLVTLTNHSVINPPKIEQDPMDKSGDREGGKPKPAIAGRAPFRASPAQQEIPNLPSRGRVEPKREPMVALRKSEKERRQAVAAERGQDELPDPEEVEAKRKANLKASAWRPQQQQTKHLSPAEREARERQDKLKASAWRPLTRREDAPLVKGMTRSKLLQEAEADLATADAGHITDGDDVRTLLKQIGELIVGVLGDAEGDLAGDGAADFTLPDGAVELDLATGAESEDEENDEKDFAKDDVEDTAPEGVNGDEDTQDY